MKRLVVLALVLLVAVPALAQERAIRVPPEPGGDKPLRDGGSLFGAWGGDPSPTGTGYFSVVEGTPTKVWLRVVAHDVSIDGSFALHASSGSLNRTSVAVKLGHGENTTIPLLLDPGTARPSSGIGLVANGNGTTSNGEVVNISIGSSATVLPGVSVAFVSPKVRFVDFGNGNLQPEPLNVGWDTTFPLTIRATNYAKNTSSPVPLAIEVFGRQIASATVPAIPAGESSTVVLRESFGIADMPEHVPSRGYVGGFQVQLYLFAERSPTEREGVWSYEFADGRVTAQRPEYATIAFHDGIFPELEASALELGKPSRIQVKITNYGLETARNIRLDVRATPVPAIYYGEGTYFKETSYVTVASLETAHLNLTFTPRVAAPHLITFEPYIGGFSQTLSAAAPMHSPVTVTPQGSPLRNLDIGDTVRLAFTINSSVDFKASDVGIAVTPAHYYGREVPFAQFVTMDDVVAVSSAPARVDLEGNAPVWVNMTIEAKAAGLFHVVPFLRHGDLLYVGRPAANPNEGPSFGGGPYTPSGPVAMPGHFELQVASNVTSVMVVWLPFAIVVAGFGSYWVYRRRMVA